MKESKFNAKKFLKDVKKSFKKRPEKDGISSENEIEEDLDSLNEDPIQNNKEKTAKGKKDGKKDFFNRVGGFFDPEPQKERVLSKEDFRRAGDVYFASVSAFYKVIERILWVVLILFLVFSLMKQILLFYLLYGQ